MQSADCRRWCLQLMLTERKRGFSAMYPDAKAALGGDATKWSICASRWAEGCSATPCAMCISEVALTHDKAKPLPLSL